ncbi:MAG: 4Fe-4S dicluster domain-containing protein [Candidatus Hodarchaeales archaeon]|jgi:heterodisulfide reductase subunit C
MYETEKGEQTHMIDKKVLLEEFKELYEVVKLCYQCGTCAGGCPVYKQYSAFNPRRIIEKLLLEDYDENIFDEQQIWYCTACYTCSTRCPQSIDVGHVIVEMKNIAVKLNNAPAGITAEMDAILESGSTAAISQSVLKRREKLGLPELPKPDTNEIQKLMDILGATTQLKGLKEVAE